MKHESLFLTLYKTYFKILLKTTHKYFTKNLKITQEQSLDIVVFSPPQFARSRHLIRSWKIDNFALVSYLVRLEH